MFPIIDNVNTGKRIRFWMRVNNLTPKDIQKYLSLSCVQTVYRWLDGTNIPTVDNLYALSGLFQVELDIIIVGNDTLSGAENLMLKRPYTHWSFYKAKKYSHP